MPSAAQVVDLAASAEVPPDDALRNKCLKELGWLPEDGKLAPKVQRLIEALVREGSEELRNNDALRARCLGEIKELHDDFSGEVHQYLIARLQ